MSPCFAHVVDALPDAWLLPSGNGGCGLLGTRKMGGRGDASRLLYGMQVVFAQPLGTVQFPEQSQGLLSGPIELFSQCPLAGRGQMACGTLCSKRVEW